MAAVMPYNYGASQEDDYDPFAKKYGGDGSGIGNGDGGNAAPVQDTSTALTGMMGYGSTSGYVNPYLNGNDGIAPPPSVTPSVYTEPPTTTGGDAPTYTGPVETAPPQQTDAAGHTGFGWVGQTLPANPVTTAPSLNSGQGTPIPAGQTGAPATPLGPSNLPPQQGDPLPPQIPVPTSPGPASTPAAPPPVAPPPVTVPSASSAVDILPTLLTGASGASGGAAQPLQSATQAATLAELQGTPSAVGSATQDATLRQLNSSSPYTSKDVQDLYTTLAGNIDTNYDANTRAINDRFARAGLYDSAGKDFASGRLADNAVQARTAKEALANDLAQNYAQTAGQYQANAINQAQGLDAQQQAARQAAIAQGQAGTGQANQSQLAWLQQLMGYGQQGFNNDMATAGFNLRQNEDQQALEEAMLAAGYGA